MPAPSFEATLLISYSRLVDDIDASMLAGADFESTKTAVLGPFYRKDVPATPTDTSIIKTMPSDGQVVYMHGTVSDASTGKPIAGAEVDVWQCSTNGLYEQQDPEQADFNLRGLLTTDENGYYGLYCLRPVPYPVPHDGKCHTLPKIRSVHNSVDSLLTLHHRPCWQDPRGSGQT